MGGLAGGVAGDRLGAAVERGRALGRDRQPGAVAADRLADAEVEDRRAVQRVGAEDEDHVGLVDVADPRREIGLGEPDQRLAAGAAGGAGVDVRGAERLAQQPLDQVALLVGGVADDRRDLALAGAQQAQRRRLDRLVPARRRAAFEPRTVDPLRVGEHLEAVAAAVAEPAVVDLGVVAPEHPFHLLVADGEADVALARAERADRAGLLDVPGPGAEAVGVVGQGADRAELGDVAVERGDVGAVVEGADEGAVAALQQLQLGVFGDLLAEAHAAVAEDAALAVDRDQRREFDRLLEVALFVDHAAFARAPALRDVLQRALAALVADGAVERVVDEQELDHRALGVLDLLGAGVDDHPLAHRGRAGGLQFRDPLDLDQAHAAGADRLAELRLVTEDRDLDVALAGGVVQHLALAGDDLAAVDRQRDLARLAHTDAPRVSAGPSTTACGSILPAAPAITCLELGAELADHRR